jgi:formylglycine-generating enzyme
MRTKTLIVAIVAVLMTVGTVQATITIDTVPVGDVSNTADTEAHSSNAAGQGAVSYAYNIGKYEVTNSQYAAFLNAVDAGGTNPSDIYNASMGTDARGGITYTSGSASGTNYTVRDNMGDKPVNYVSYWDACRFANWLGNGQGSSSTETGAYTLTSDGMTNNTVTRNASATWAVASEDEWYKAAYYKGGSTTAGYWTYETQSNTTPTEAAADALGNISNPGANVVNYNFGAVWNGKSGNVTTVGGATSASYYGTFDQGGNVWEWNDAVLDSTYRGLRGGSFSSSDYNLQGEDRYHGDDPSNGYYNVGFRVSQIPEPASMTLLALGGIGMMFRRRGLRG